MDNFDELPSTSDMVSSRHLTLAVFPMYFAIGQIFFDKTYFFLQNQYLKIYVDQFSHFLQLHFHIVELLIAKTQSLKKLPFASLNTWQVLQENDNFVCIIESPKNYQLKFDHFEFQQLVLRLRDILFKPLCLPTIYSFNLQKVAAYLSNNAIENPDNVHLFTHQNIEKLVIELFVDDHFVDQYYLMELIIRHKKLIKDYIEIENLEKLTTTCVNEVPEIVVDQFEAAEPLKHPKKIKYTQSKLISNLSGLKCTSLQIQNT